MKKETTWLLSPSVWSANHPFQPCQRGGRAVIAATNKACKAYSCSGNHTPLIAQLPSSHATGGKEQDVPLVSPFPPSTASVLAHLVELGQKQLFAGSDWKSSNICCFPNLFRGYLAPPYPYIPVSHVKKGSKVGRLPNI